MPTQMGIRLALARAMTLMLGWLAILGPATASANSTLDVERYNLHAICPQEWRIDGREPGWFGCPTPDGEVQVYVRRDPQEYPGEIYGRSAYELTAALIRAKLILPPRQALELRDADLPVPGKSQYARFKAADGRFVHAFIFNREVDPLERAMGRLASFWPYTGRGYGYAFLLTTRAEQPPAGLTNVAGSFRVRDEVGSTAYIQALGNLRALVTTGLVLLLMLLVGGLVNLLNQGGRQDLARPSTAAAFAGLVVVGASSTLALIAEVPPIWVAGEATTALIAPFIAALFSLRSAVLDHTHLADDDPALRRTRQRLPAQRRERKPRPETNDSAHRPIEPSAPPKPEVAAAQRKARDEHRISSSHRTAYIPPRPKTRKDDPNPG